IIATLNRNSRNDIKGYLGVNNRRLIEEDDYKKLILPSNDAYNYLREKYSRSTSCIYELDLYAHPLCRWLLFNKIEFSINDPSSDFIFKTVVGFLEFKQKFKENFEIFKNICINYISDEEHDRNLEEE
ncbi:4867_t:CDS:2, partial [Scutellospora calospora]